MTTAVLAAALTTGAVPAHGAVSPVRVITSDRLDVEDFAIAMNPSGTRSTVAFAARERGKPTGQVKLYARLGRGRALDPARLIETLRTASGPRVDVSDAKAAIAPDGSAAVTWIATTGRTKRVRIATAVPGQSFTKPRTVFTTSARSLVLTGVVSGRIGLLVVSWRRGAVVEAAVRQRSTRFSKPQTLGTSDTFDPPTLALAPSGVTIATWSTTLMSPSTAVLPLGSKRFRRVADRTDSTEVTFPRIVTGPGGAALAGTAHRSGTGLLEGQLFASRLSGDSFGTPFAIADDGSAGAPYASLSRRGISTAWRHYRVVSNAGEDDRLTDSRVSANASWLDSGATRRLSDLPALAGRPAVAALHDRSLVAWTEQTDNSQRLRLAVAGPTAWLPTRTFWRAPSLTAGTPVSPVQTTFPEQRAVGELAIAAGPHAAILAWLGVTPAAGGAVVGRLRLMGYRP